MKNAAAIVLALALITAMGCQSSQLDSSAGDDTQEALVPDKDLGELKDAERLIFTDLYAGRLFVHFDESIVIRLDQNAGTFYSDMQESASAIEAIHGILDDFSDIAIKRSVSTSELQVAIRRAELEKLSGKKLADWNSIYLIEIKDPSEAVRLMRAFEDCDGVELVYPDQVLQLTSLGTTPDLITHQGYLYGSSQGGLDAVAAWNQGIYGQGVMLVDVELGWHVDHLDLPISADPNPELGFGSYCTAAVLPDPICDFPITHGTGVLGIMAAIDNGHGVTGIAPQSQVKLAAGSAGPIFTIIETLTNGDDADGEASPGSVIVLPADYAGALAPATYSPSDVTNQYGHLPLEVMPAVYDVLEQAVAAGVTVVESAANGQVDLDNPDVYYPYQSDLSQSDSGAIIVGASQGPNYQRISWSNCGSRVDSYAWGQNIATTGYPYNGSYDWFGTAAPLPPNTDNDAYFVDMFDGTSGATAMVAGAAALVQSYAKQRMNDTRFLMPSKVREILSATGTPQSGGGCSIGTQPDIGETLTAAASAINAWEAAYPNLVTNQPIAQQDMLDLRAAGLGIVCKDDPAESDPVCPDESMWVPGSGIAEHLDFDADGRADLVSWSRGRFKIDFSSIGGSSDGFGAWDTIINYPEIVSGWVRPYVGDMNSDGREDLVLYDKENGTWYIAYTTSALISGGGFSGWDHVITTPIADQLEMDPYQSFFCRPHPGDYDGNGWIDLAVACSDGVWYIADRDANDDRVVDYDWPTNGSIPYDNLLAYLTPQQLGLAPGWAYLTSTADYNQDSVSDIIVKVPDTIPEEGRLIVLEGPEFTTDVFETKPHIYGGNDWIVFMGEYRTPGELASVGIKGSSGMWQMADPDYYLTLNDVYPGGIYGDASCHPIAADFDGDGLDDRAVMCPYEWKVAYSGTDYAALMQDGYRAVNLSYAGAYSLPGRSYSGGISYEGVQDLLDYYKLKYPSDPPRIPVDMFMIGNCDMFGGEGCYP